MKLKNLFVSLLAVAVAAIACDELNNLDETITSELTELAFATAEGGSETISFVAPAAWTAEVTEGAEWITIEPTSGEGSTEAQSISVTVDENPDTLAREGEITITMGAADPLAIPVTQAAGAKEDEPIVSVETWGLVGTMTNWGDPTEDGTVMSDIAMIADGSYYAAMGVTLTTADEFKFRTNNTWGTERTTSVNPVTPDTEYEAVEGSGNIKVSADGTYDIYLTVALDKFYVMNEGKTPEQAGEPEPVEDVWQLIGVNGDWTTPLDMNQTAGILEGDWWVASGVSFTEGVYFKIFANNSWSDDAKNIGFVTEEQVNSGAALNVAIPVGTKTTALANGLDDSKNIWLTEGTGGVYDVWFNVTDMVVYVMTEGYKPGDTPVIEPEFEAGNYYIAVNVDGVANVARSVSGSYGYLSVEPSLASDAVAGYLDDVFTFAAVEGGYTIQDAAGKYYYQTVDFNSFNLAAELPAEGGVWAVRDLDADGLFETITNTTFNRYFQYSTTYSSFGAYADAQDDALMPYLVKAENSIERPIETIDATASVVNAAENGDTRYRVSGYVSSIKSATWGNLYIKDYTGEVYVYGTLDAEGNTKNFESLGIKEGDIVTVVGPKTSYNGSPQMKNVTVESHSPVTDITVSDFLGKADDANVWYRLSGEITNITNTTYGNFYIKDESGSEVYVYGLYNGYGAGNKTFSEIGLNVGDTVTLVGYHATYGTTIEVKDAFYISHVAGTTEPEEPEVPADSVSCTMIDKVADLHAGTYYMGGYLTSYTNGDTTTDWSSYPYHLCTGVSTDLFTATYSYANGALTKNPDESYDAVEVTLEGVSGKENTYYVKFESGYLYSTSYANRKLAVGETPVEWVATDNANGGITLTTTMDEGTVSLGTAGAASKLLRSYKTESTLKYGLVFFLDSTTK